MGLLTLQYLAVIEDLLRKSLRRARSFPALRLRRDLIGGTSAGSILAARHWRCGMTVEQLDAIHQARRARLFRDVVPAPLAVSRAEVSGRRARPRRRSMRELTAPSTTLVRRKILTGLMVAEAKRLDREVRGRHQRNTTAHRSPS